GVHRQVVAFLVFSEEYLHVLALSYVTRVDNNPGDPGLGQQILSHRFQNPPRSILMSITKLNTTRIVIFLDSAVKNFQHPPNIIGVNKLEGAFPHQLEGLISEHALY